jgi:ubiquinone/menaquinone biosynthesis C-methylase UbiE
VATGAAHDESDHDGQEGGLAASRRFWETKARENPYWYVSSHGPYDRRNLEEFWRSGFKIWDDLKSATGYRPRPDHTVVEIGCGVGRLTRAIAPQVGRVLALDIAEEMLTVARTGAPPNATFHRSDGRTLPVPGGSADLVVAYCVFQHLPTVGILGQYLAEMVRVARPHALVVFTLSPPRWTDALRPLLRGRRFIKERLSPDGPRGLYRREWLGIRPSVGTVRGLSPILLAHTTLHGDKSLFHGRTAA